MRDNVLSTSEVARHFGCRAWQVRRLFERGLLPPAQRIGRYRYVAVSDLQAVEGALARAGYIQPGRLLEPEMPAGERVQGASTRTPAPSNESDGIAVVVGRVK
jgi:hypothetical protein